MMFLYRSGSFRGSSHAVAEIRYCLAYWNKHICSEDYIQLICPPWFSLADLSWQNLCRGQNPTMAGLRSYLKISSLPWLWMSSSKQPHADITPSAELPVCYFCSKHVSLEELAGISFNPQRFQVPHFHYCATCTVTNIMAFYGEEDGS